MHQASRSSSSPANAFVMQADFDLPQVIARGSFGIVYKAVRKSDGRVFALKQVKLKGMKRVDREEAIDEARVLSQLAHPHITQHHGSFIDDEEQLNILMEFATNGSLHARIRAAPGKVLPEAQVWRFILQALLGLGHIHSRRIIHRDIKSLNLFLDSRDNIKIGDLGIARSLSGGSNFARTIVGTPLYLSPELCDDKPYNEKSDVWALGVVLYECCMGRYPFEAQNEGALIRKILRGAFAPIAGPYSPGLQQLAAAMLAFDPRRRPTVAQLLQMPAVISQARALGIDMACRMPPEADPPLFEQPAVRQQPSQQQQPLQQVQQQQQQQQQQQRPSSAQQQRQASHPFDLPAGSPAAAKPAAAPPIKPHQQQQPAATCHYPGDMAAIAQLQQMMAAAGVGPQAAAAGTHMQQLPVAAGLRPGSARAAVAAPYAQLSNAGGGGVCGALTQRRQQATSAQEAAAGIWTVQFAPPMFGRRRCPELMATTPSLRSGGPGVQRGLGYTPMADDATSYCTTSYQTTS